MAFVCVSSVLLLLLASSCQAAPVELEDAGAMKEEKPVVDIKPYGYGQFGHLAPSEWLGVCATGQSQSPININSEEAEPIDIEEPFVFHGYDDEIVMQLAYHDYMAVLTLPEGFSASIEGGGLKAGKYELNHVGMHWHQGLLTGSEHKLDGQGYPVELHFVHRCAGESMKSAESKPGCVVVLAVFGEIRVPFFADELTESVDTLDNVFFTPDVTVHKRATSVSLMLSELLPADVDSFYRYEGSSTAPSCYEGVVWTVFEDTLPISQLMLDGLRLMRNVALQHTFILDNARPVQPLNDRPVLYYAVNATSAHNMTTEH